MLDNSQIGRLRMLASACCFVVGSVLLFDPCSAASLEGSLYLKNVRVSSALHVVQQPQVFLMSERASSSMIGTIMALLATFDEAGILPPEGTAQANQVIHGLIQLQSTLMKSTSAELAAYQMAAEDSWRTQHQGMQDSVLQKKELTLRVLEALIVYDQEHQMWSDPKIGAAMQEFNVSQADWLFIVRLFRKADAVFRDQGRSMHTVYHTWRMKFPGGTS